MKKKKRILKTGELARITDDTRKKNGDRYHWYSKGQVVRIMECIGGDYRCTDQIGLEQLVPSACLRPVEQFE